MQITNLVGQYHNSTATAAEGISPTKGVEQLVATVRSLTAGNIFEGTINYSKNGHVILGLSNGSQLSARLADHGLKLQQGESMFFQVKSNDGEQIQIAPYKIAGVGANLTLISALSAAGLPMEGDYLSMVDKMMQEKMPIDKASLNQMAKLVTSYPKESIATLVEMKKIGLPITKEMIAQYENYKTDQHSVMKGLTEFVEKLPQTLQQEEVPGVKLQAYQKGFVDMLLQKQEISSTPMTMLTEQEVENLDSIIREVVWNTPEEKMEFLKKEDSIGAVFEKLQKAMGSGTEIGKEALLKLASSPEFQKIVKVALEQVFMVSPEQLAEEKDQMGKLYDRLQKNLREFSQLAQTLGAGSEEITSLSTELKNNIDFMNQVNQFYQYIQLPLKMSQQNAAGELYVYTSRRNPIDENQELSAFLHLDLEHLGSTDISIKMLHKTVDTKFYMESEEAYDLVVQNWPILQDRLRKKGYEFSAQVVNEKKNVNVVTDLLRRDIPQSHQIKRYSFDIRA